jgi:hypothetical protein
MKRLSSFTTPAYKMVFRLVPILVLAYAGVVTVLRESSGIAISNEALLSLVGLAAILYLAYKLLIAGLADVVLDEGTFLAFTYGERRLEVPLENIARITRSAAISPSHTTVHLRHPTDLGSMLSFSPALNSEAIARLCERSLAAQRSNPSVKGTSCGKPQAAPYVER